MSIAIFETEQTEANSQPTNCPICRGATSPWLALPGDWRRPHIRKPLRLHWCASCDYGSLLPRPSLAEVAEAYDLDDYYTHHASQPDAGDRSLLDRLLVKLAWHADRGVEANLNPASLARFGLAPRASLCDVGCGNGSMLETMAAAGYDVVGIEPDADARRVVIAAGLNVVAGSAEELPPDLDDRRFDVVTMMHVLEHTLDPLAAVRNIAGLLKPGGTFVVETPNNACRGLLSAGTAWRWLDVPRHTNFFTAESLQTVCVRAGLTVAAVEYTGYVRQFQQDWIRDEQEIRRRLIKLAAGDERFTALPSANSTLKAFGLLRRTMLAAPVQKYDSVRVVARKS